jgi:hypothetical protein
MASKPPEHRRLSALHCNDDDDDDDDDHDEDDGEMRHNTSSDY